MTHLVPTRLVPTIDELLPGLNDLWQETDGDQAVCVAVLDGPVDLGHACFDGGRLTKISTLASAAATKGAALAHGTHVASVIFGQSSDSIRGISPRCRGVVIPIFGECSGGEPVPCSQVDLARAINLAIQAGADVINISGGQPSATGTAHPILADAIQRCTAAGVLVVAAAGNQGCDCLQIPAALPAVLPVGAMDGDGIPLPFSNWGDGYRMRGVLAPGTDIKGATPGGGVSHATGTSYATAVVSGVVALLMSAYLKEYGTKPSALCVRDAILASAVGCRQPLEDNRKTVRDRYSTDDGQRLDYGQSAEDCRRFLAGRLSISRTKSMLFGRGATSMIEPQCVTQCGDEADRSVSDLDINGPSVGRNVSSLDAGILNASRHNARVHSEKSGVTATLARIPAGVNPAGAGKSCGCGCGGSDVDSGDVGSGDSEVNVQPLQLVYALGQLGVDFGTEARRDSFAQLMSPVADDRDRVVAPHGNPQDLRQLLRHLDANPWDAASLTWTLSIDATPVYGEPNSSLVGRNACAGDQPCVFVGHFAIGRESRLGSLQ